MNWHFTHHLHARGHDMKISLTYSQVRLGHRRELWEAHGFWRGVVVTVTAVFILRPLLGDRGHITKQSPVCILVFIGWLEKKCFQLATKSTGRSQQLQLCRQPVPCSWSDDRESPVVDLSTHCLARNKTALRRARLGLGWVTIFGWCTISVCNQPTRSTQPCITPGSLNRVPACFAGVKAGMSALLGGR